MNVLFVCADNAALSIMAESILRATAPARFGAFSAACCSPGRADAAVLGFLAAHHLPVAGLRAKGVEEFRAAAGAARMDFVITLCDAAAAESYAGLSGEPFVAHWSVEEGEAGSEVAMRDRFWTLMRRIKIFASLPEARLSRRVLERRALTLQAAYL